MTIANTILELLSGNHFIVMTGAKNFVADGNTLRMTLETTDTYTMYFF